MFQDFFLRIVVVAWAGPTYDCAVFVHLWPTLDVTFLDFFTFVDPCMAMQTPMNFADCWD